MGSSEPDKGPVGSDKTGEVLRKPRFLCLHGFHTSGTIMKKQIMSKWPSHITSRLDLFFADAPFSVKVASDMVRMFPPPYFEWFQFNEGLALTKVPKIKCVVIISGALFLKPEVAENAYCPKIECPSLHFLGKENFMSVEGEKLLAFFKEPLVIRHSKGHTIPRLDEESLDKINAFLSKIEGDLASVSCSVEDKSPVEFEFSI